MPRPRKCGELALRQIRRLAGFGEGDDDRAAQLVSAELGRTITRSYLRSLDYRGIKKYDMIAAMARAFGVSHEAVARAAAHPREEVRPS